jgi:hypothetical protein
MGASLVPRARSRGARIDPQRLRHAPQRTHPRRGWRKRYIETVVPASLPAAPKQTARGEARARASEHSRRVAHRVGQFADGRFAMGDSQQDAQVERTQMLAVDQFQEAVEGHGSVLACGRIAGRRERACRRFELGGVAACAGRRPVAPSWRRDIALSRRTSIIVLASHRRGVVGRSESWRQVRGHAASVRAR